jgi:hypothetical protein
MATEGRDLMAAWDLPPAAWTGAQMKICRKKYGSQQLDLVNTSTLEDYSLEGTAREYGAGEYVLIFPGDPLKSWGAHSISVPVSADYARTVGFNNLPASMAAPAPQMPRISEARAFTETAAAMAAPGSAFTPQAMMQLVEAVADRVAQRIQPAPAVVAPVNPMEQFGTMFQFFQMMQTQQASAIKSAFEMAGMKAPGNEEPTPTNWAEVAMAVGPPLLESVKTIFQRPEPIHPQPAAAPMQAAPIQEPAPMIQVPLSQAEAAPMARAIAMLRPFVGMIVTGLERLEDGAELAPDLAAYIPGPLAPQLVTLAGFAAARGKNVLAIISPSLATDRGLECLIALGDLLKGEK